jgi:hypothetical protein
MMGGRSNVARNNAPFVTARLMLWQGFEVLNMATGGVSKQIKLALSVGSLLGVVAATGHAAAQQQIAVPTYFFPTFDGAGNPTGYWDQFFDAVPTAGLGVINPNSGPGAAPSTSYQNLMNKKPSGVKVIGYVYSSYGARDVNAVKADIDKYYLWYPNVDGIFVDEANNNSCTIEANYYRQLYSHVKAKSASATVVLNPGAVTLECYVNSSDILITFESDFSSYNTTWHSGHAWEVNYPASRFWHLVHNTSAGNMATALNLSRQRNAGWVYVTDDVMPNPWDTLASYWWSEVADVSAASGCAGGGNIIQNCGFSNGMTSWDCDFGGTATGTCSVVNAELQTVVTSPGTATYQVQPNQTPLALTQNRTYTVSFDARASVARPITVSVSMNHTPWSSYSGTRTFNLTTGMATYSFTFTMTAASDSDVKFEFGLGANGSNTVYMDNVAIR